MYSGNQKVSKNVPFEIAAGSKVSGLDDFEKKQVSQKINDTTDTTTPVTLHLHTNTKPEEEDLADIKAFVSSVNYSLPTQALIHLTAKYEAIKNKKSRAKHNNKLNPFEKERLLNRYSKVLAFLTEEKKKVMYENK